MKQLKYVPGRKSSKNILNHVATKCGRCDGYVGDIGGQKPKKDYVVLPKAKQLITKGE
jgi:hypothetical protein